MTGNPSGDQQLFVGLRVDGDRPLALLGLNYHLVGHLHLERDAELRVRRRMNSNLRLDLFLGFQHFDWVQIWKCFVYLLHFQMHLHVFLHVVLSIETLSALWAEERFDAGVNVEMYLVVVFPFEGLCAEFAHEHPPWDRDVAFISHHRKVRIFGMA